jgi:hypothetical protein
MACLAFGSALGGSLRLRLRLLLWLLFFFLFVFLVVFLLILGLAQRMSFVECGDQARKKTFFLDAAFLGAA